MHFKLAAYNFSWERHKLWHRFRDGNLPPVCCHKPMSYSIKVHVSMTASLLLITSFNRHWTVQREVLLSATGLSQQPTSHFLTNFLTLSHPEKSTWLRLRYGLSFQMPRQSFQNKRVHWKHIHIEGPITEWAKSNFYFFEWEVGAITQVMQHLLTKQELWDLRSYTHMSWQGRSLTACVWVNVKYLN